ncbi:hypothetical protein [Neomoorella thermoacetica]|uniref:hypothetical protein n=1 Tax=Neomoorella thermoacetica TaxID=1525 RepID=UPI001F3F2364|nr:hypothetical protein [Moorella thermoacetica]
MEPLGLILVAVALGTDAFSLATGLALGGSGAGRLGFLPVPSAFFTSSCPWRACTWGCSWAGSWVRWQPSSVPWSWQPWVP